MHLQKHLLQILFPFLVELLHLTVKWMQKQQTKLHEIFLEIIIAPSFSEEALEILTNKKKNLRLLTIPFNAAKKPELKMTTIEGGLLVQDQDRYTLEDATITYRNETTTNRGRVGSIEARLEGCKTCEIKCDCCYCKGYDTWYWCRTNEPSRFC